MLILLLLHFLFFYIVTSYPSAPGTCNMNKMATIGHGPSQSTCKDCYGVQISTNSSNLVNIQLSGRFPYQGIVLLVKDKYTNKTLGEFQDFDEELFTPVACDDDEDEQDTIEQDTIAVLGHIDAKDKNWPVNVGWNMIVNEPLTELKLQGMVVIDYFNFHLIPETEFKLKRKVIETTNTSSTTNRTATATTTINKAVETHTIIEVEHEAGTFVQQQSNTLFIWVLTIILTFYFLLSTCYRQFIIKRKSRVTTKKNINSMLNQDEISLIVLNTTKDN